MINQDALSRFNLRPCLFGQYQYLIVQYFDDTTLNIKELLLLFALIYNLDLSFDQNGDQRGMVVQDFKGAVDAGKLHQLYMIAGKDDGIGGYNFNFHINYRFQQAISYLFQWPLQWFPPY